MVVLVGSGWFQVVVGGSSVGEEMVLVVVLKAKHPAGSRLFEMVLNTVVPSKTLIWCQLCFSFH